MRTLLISTALMLSLAACGKSTEPPPATGDTAEAPAPAADATAADSAPATPTDPALAAGEAVFKRCVACHTLDPSGRNGIGPDLWGVVGRAVATQPGFAYSAAMKAKGGVWDEAALDAYLTSPMRTVPGGKMAFAGLPNAADRAAVIAYLKSKTN
jgi:cytochrome c